MDSEVVLTGLDATNPLCFLASLGVLQIITEQSTAAAEPRLCFREQGYWLPVVSGVEDLEAVISMVEKDLATWNDDPALSLRYQKEGGKTAHDLKPLPSRFRKYLQQLVESDDPRKDRALQFAGAFGTETVVDNKGNIKPTAFHFTAGQQEFLAMIDTLAENLTMNDVLEALRGPWTYSSSLPVLQWDSSAARSYALRASDPSKDKKQGVPGADWLAFRGLPTLPVAPTKNLVTTTGVSGGWKTGHFTWSLWTVPLELETARSVVSYRQPDSLSPAERQSRGVGAILRSRIHRTDQGGYGSFAPAQLL